MKRPKKKTKHRVASFRKVQRTSLESLRQTIETLEIMANPKAMKAIRKYEAGKANMKDVSCLDENRRPSSGSRCHQHNPLSRPQRIMKRLVNVLQRILRRDIVEGSAGLDEMAEMIGTKFLMLAEVFVQNEQRFILIFG